MDESRQYFADVEAYRQAAAASCFICELVGGRKPHHVFYEDTFAIAFLSKYPSLRGHALVAPKQHLERVTADFDTEAYLKLQSLVYRVGEAIRNVIETERLYIMSMGSQQANRHVHWHVAPLPPGLPFEKQQFAAFTPEAGYLNLSPDEMASIASELRLQMS